MNTALQNRNGAYIGPRETFRASGQIVAAAGVLPFLVINGAAGKVIRVQNIRFSGLNLTAVAYLRIAIGKAIAAWIIGAGAKTSPAGVKLDSVYPAAPLAVVDNYSAGPTGGGGGAYPATGIAERTVLGQANVAVAAGIPSDVVFDFATSPDNELPTLRGIAENLYCLFATAPATAATFSYEIEWTEDGN
jgi:hypothetical protein